MLLIQDEPLVGTTAFWFTRPISNGTLLAGKAVFVTGFLILPPLAVEVILFAVNGIEMRDILLMMPEVFLTSLSLIVAASALAVITRNFAQFMLWLIIAWTVLAVVNGMVQFGRMLFSDNYLESVQNMTLLSSRTLMAGIVQTVGGLTIILNQYLTRRTRVSVAILIATAFAQTVIQTLWEHDFFEKPTVPVSVESFTPEAVKIEFKPNTTFASDAVQFGNFQEPRTAIRGELAFTEVPAGFQLSVTNVSAEITFPDGTSVHSLPSPSLAYTSLREWWAEPLSYLLDGAQIMNGDKDSSLYSQIFLLPTESFQKWRSTPGVLEGTVTLAAQKLEVVGQLPLRAGSRIDLGSKLIEIGQVLHQTDGCRILMRERKLNFWWDRLPSQFSATGDDDGVYLLVNRARKEAVLPDRDFQFDMASLMLRATSRLINRSFFLQFTGERHRHQVFAIDKEWLEEAELVRIEGRPAGELERPLFAEGILLQRKN